MDDDEGCIQTSYDVRTIGRASTTPLEFRSRFGLTQEELGRVVGRSRQAVGSWETGRNSPDRAAQRLMDRLSQSTVDEIKRLAGERADDRGFSHWIAEAKTSPDVRTITRANGDEFLDITRRAARYSAPVGELISIARSAPVAPPVLGSVQDPLSLPLGLTALGARSATLPRADGIAYATWADEPQTQWLLDGESVTVPPVALVLENVRRCTVATTMSVSRRLLKYTGGAAEALIAARVLSALSRAVEAAAIGGSGTGAEPAGILNHPNAAEYSPESGFGYLDLLAMIEDLEGAGVPLSAIGAVCSPTTARELRQLPIEVGNERYLLGGAALIPDGNAGIPCRTIAGIRDNTLLIGAFSELVILTDDMVTLRMVENADGSHTIFGFLDCGVSLARPGAMVWSRTL